MPLRGLVLLVFFLASIPVCFVRPFYGVALWCVVSFLNPQSFTWTAFDALPWAVAVAIPTLTGMFLFERKFERLASREVALLLILWGWFTVTTIVSTSRPEFAHHAFETAERWKFVSKIILMTICMIPVVNSFSRLRILMLTLAGCFGVFVLKSLPFVIATGGTYRLYGPERSMIADNTDLGMALVMTLPIYYGLAQVEKKAWMKAALWFTFLITFPAIFFTYSRGALVGCAVVFTLTLIQSRRRLALIPVAVVALAVAVSFAPEQWQQRMDLTRPEAMDASARSRLSAWAFARALAADYPVTGGGFSTFTEQMYEKYWPGEIGTIYGPHSVYFQVLAEHGYVGLALYLMLAGSCFMRTWQLRRAAKRYKDQEVAVYALMLRLVMVGFLTCGAFLGRAYFDYYFATVASIVILHKVAADRWAVLAPAQAPAVDVSWGKTHVAGARVIG
jgi:probable O-glycosylation ligase (exosortase A-associated)